MSLEVHTFNSARAGAVLSSTPLQGLNSERGYTLVALLAVMSLIALFALEAAPIARQQAQREREKEAIFRGQQVADAIRRCHGVAGAMPREHNGYKIELGKRTLMRTLAKVVAQP